MKELIQAKVFYDSLEPEEKRELCEAIAEDIFFLDDDLQRNVLHLLRKISPELSNEIRKINSFTS